MAFFNVRVITALLLVIMMGLQLSLVIHFWQSFQTGDPVGGQILIGIAAVMAVIEVFMLAVAADRLRNGLKTEGRVWGALFFAVLFVSALAEFGAIASVTGADHAQRQQAAFAYTQQQADLERLDADIGALQTRLQALNLNAPSAAIAAELAANQEIAARYQAVDAEVPSRLLRRIASLESARITAVELEETVARREALATSLQSRDAAPQDEHPQFVAIATALGGDWTAEKVRTTLPILMVVVFKLVTVLGFWVIARPHGFDRYDDSANGDQNDDAGGDGDPNNGQGQTLDILGDGDGLTLDVGLDARNEAASRRTAPPPPLETVGTGRRTEPLNSGDGDVIKELDEFFDEVDQGGDRRG
jgi:hypothetical protein